MTAQIQEYSKAVARGEGPGMDPLEAGRLVLRGMRNNDLYILTDTEVEPVMRDRSDALMASIPRYPSNTQAAARPTDDTSVYKTSIYKTERDRVHCEGLVRK